MNTNKLSFRVMVVVVLLSLLALSGTAAAEGDPPIIYVNDNAVGLNNGESWDDAYTDLQSALGAAVVGDEIWVAQGTYKPGGLRTDNFQLKNEVEIYGGFPEGGGTWDQRNPDPATNNTILSGDLVENDGDNFANNGDNSYHVVYGSDTDASAVLDGFVIIGGNANGGSSVSEGGGGMYNHWDSSPSLTNVTFSGNSASEGGGGMYNYRSSPILTDVTFIGNTASNGGGMDNYNYSLPTLTNVTFHGNSASANGGGMRNSSSGPPILTNVIFRVNSAMGSGGGMYNKDYSDPTLTNVTFIGNTADNNGGGMYNYESRSTLTNVTFSGNSASTGSGIYNSGDDSTASITNSIFWGNSGGVLIYDTLSLGTTMSCSDIEGGWGGIGAYNINANPLFVDDPDPGSDGIWGSADDDYGDLQLQVGSPAIDAGCNFVVVIDIDLAGNPRIVDGDGDGTATVDMGAYENQGNQENDPPVADPDGPYLGALESIITFDGTGSSDPDNDTLTYAWTFGDGNIGTGSTPTHSYAAAEIYDVCLTVNDGTVNSEEVCTIVVIYDPGGGFVTGGGWISSPSGAYIADPSLSGKATFGFVSKYKKGASIPTGNTEFQFKAGDFNFHSSSYEWLVVTGSDFAKFKGTGTINGMNTPNDIPYKFMLWAGDKELDTFHIKIWWEDESGEHDVYDNGFEGSEYENGQPISGGNIVVHTKKK